MRRLFWMIVLFGAYIWVMTTGRDGFVLEQGKLVYNAVISWFDDAEIDFQVNPKDKQKSKKKSRRWD